ncbi:MAG: ParA family protein [Oligoflexia bacterium]|nr:ParA family protein [Oligoflexia bacterium]
METTIPDVNQLQFNQDKFTQQPPKTLAIATQKGGVGKTFLTINTAAILASRGLKTLIIDADPESCTTHSLVEQVPPESLTMLEIYQHDKDFSEAVIPTKIPNLFLIPCKAKARKTERITISKNPKYLVANKLEKLKREFDFIFFDLPPSFSNLIASFYLASDLIIQPCEPTVYGEESVDLTIADIVEECKEYDCRVPEIKILLNFYRENERASRETREALQARYSDQFLPFCVSKSQDILNIINSGMTVVDAKTSATEQIAKLADFIAPITPKLQ